MTRLHFARKDWSLVFFTTVTQASIGITLCLAVLNFSGTLSWQGGPGLFNPVLLALLLVGIATLVSLAHLGNPRNAPRALCNLASSWLSREILAIGLYSAFLTLTFLTGWADGPALIHDLLLALSAIAAVALLWSMTRIYMIETIPPWNTCHTRLGFTATSLSLGPGILLAGQFAARIQLSDMAVGALMGLLCTMLAAELVSAVRYQTRLERMNRGLDAPVFDRGVFYRWYQARLAVLGMALFAFVACALVLATGGPVAAIWIYLSLTLVLVQEILGRTLFYAAYFRVGV